MFSLGEILKMQCQPTYQGFFKKNLLKKMWSKYSKIHLFKKLGIFVNESFREDLVFKS